LVYAGTGSLPNLPSADRPLQASLDLIHSTGVHFASRKARERSYLETLRGASENSAKEKPDGFEK
jgi:hypothetical protein